MNVMTEFNCEWQEIDLPDIELVVQWRMSCDLCSLWQRFGRGARDPNCQAMAIVFVESKFFDHSRSKKAENKVKKMLKAAQKKWPATEGTGSEPVLQKRCPDGPQEFANTVALPSPSPTVMSNTQVLESIGLDAQRVVEYSKHETKGGQRVKRVGDELGPAEDDFVNAATRHFGCYRRPIMLYFGNNGHGK